MSNEIIAKVEKSIKTAAAKDAKFQQANRPSGVVFNPTSKFRRVHLTAQLTYKAK